MDELVIKTAKSAHHAFQSLQRLWHLGGSLLPPIFKSVIVGLLLFYVQVSGFSFFPILLFIGVALICYTQPVYKSFTLGTSLVVMLALGLLLTSRFTIMLPVELHASAFGQSLFSIAFGFLFFILLGIKNVILVRRREWYSVLFIALVYGINLLFFTSTTGGHVIRDLLLIALLTYLLLREYFSVQEHPYHRAFNVITLTVTILLVQSAWALSLLPLGFSKAASLLTLLAIMLAGIIDRYIRGTLTARFLRLSFILFVALTGIIFLSVRWVL